MKGCHTNESKQNFAKHNVETLNEAITLSKSCELNQFIRLAGDRKKHNQHVILMDLNFQRTKPTISNHGEK